MRYPIILLCLLILALTFSCKNDDTSSTETPAAEETTDPAAVAFPSMPPANTLQPGTATQPSMAQQQVAPQQQVIPSQPVSKSTSNQGPLNPVHGQPGHRCEIPVGAPLSTAPKVQQQAPANLNTQPVQPLNTTPINTTPGSDPANMVTPPGMNPPHGQPGHKCEIAVGAPLPTE